MNALGIYLLVSLCFVVLAMIEFAIILLWSRVPRTNGAIVSPKVFERRASHFSGDKKEKHNLKKGPFGMSSMYILDFISFWSFLIFYLVFNVVYWTHFYQK